eukprot:scaffold124411_cov84-Phaeocystis_antarctica.AAC.1
MHTASPGRPARPVRPAICMYDSVLSGSMVTITRSTCGRSIPRIACSCATSTAAVAPSPPPLASPAGKPSKTVRP